LSNRLDLLIADDRLLQARLAVANLEAAARDADIALVQALGGGIEPAARQSALPLNSKDNAHG
jgi:outer membrane protein TolC